MTPSFLRLSCFAALIFSAGIACAQEEGKDIFREEDSLAITVSACTRDAKPVEGRFQLVTSFSDAQRLNKSIPPAGLEQSIASMWRQILRRLSYKDIFDPERTKATHDLMSGYVAALEKKTEAETGISLSIYQIESRPMDRETEPDAPSCSFDL